MIPNDTRKIGSEKNREFIKLECTQLMQKFVPFLALDGVAKMGRIGKLENIFPIFHTLNFSMLLYNKFNLPILRF